MNIQDFTTKVAGSIVCAFNEAVKDLPENASAREHKIVENSFFEVVVAYKTILSSSQYESLCNKIVLMGGRVFEYWPVN